MSSEMEAKCKNAKRLSGFAPLFLLPRRQELFLCCGGSAWRRRATHQPRSLFIAHLALLKTTFLVNVSSRQHVSARSAGQGSTPAEVAC